MARPTINALLDEGTRGPVTLVCAGAGWGKTLATAAWASAGPPVGDVAWVSLDAGDNQPRAFWSSVLASLRATVRPPPGNPLARLLPGLGSHEDFLPRLVEGLSRLPRPVVVVLDDFDAIDDRELLLELSSLVRVPPPQLRLVLLTRSDPLLPLQRLRLAGTLGEIRAQHLAMTAPEATALMAHDGVALEPADARLLVGRTEGWPAGLRLAALFLARDGRDRTVQDFGGEDQAVVEYLAEEVLGRHPPHVQRFLMQTSVAERVNGGLVEALTGEPRGQLLLESLASSNTFVVGLGPGREWYRYHALLRQMLRHRLVVETPHLVPELHRRAALWLAEHGHPIEALNHAADAEDWTLAGQLFVAHALPLSVSVERAALDRVLSRIPNQRLADSPELALAAATRLMHLGRFADMEPHLVRAGEQISTSHPREPEAATRVGHLVLSMISARSRGDVPALIDTATGALDELSGRGLTLPAAQGYRTVALGNLGAGHLWTGRLADAERTLLQGLAEAEGTTLDASRVNMLSHLALVEALSGRLQAARGHACQATRIVEEHGWAPLHQAATAYLALAIVHFQQNRIAEARAALAEGRPLAAPEPTARVSLALIDVRINASVGLVDVARAQIAQLHRERAGWRAPALLDRWSRVAEAEVDLADGQPASAIARIEAGAPESRGASRVPERLVLARALLDSSEPRRAENTLAALRDVPLRSGPLVETWVLTALAADRLREDRRATEALRHALHASEPDGIRRPFVALDPTHLPRLLGRVAHLHPNLQKRVEELRTDGVPAPTTTSDVAPAAALTQRELSVLQYLPTMMTVPEIAGELFVSVNTVKSHLKHIYAKLDVINRRQAVARARHLGLLDP